MTKRELEEEVGRLEGRVEELEAYLEAEGADLAEAVAKNDELRWAFKVLAT